RAHPDHARRKPGGTDRRAHGSRDGYRKSRGHGRIGPAGAANIFAGAGGKVRDLPLNGRNPLALVALTPAVIPQSGSQSSPAGQNPLSPGNFQIGGGTANQSQAFLDGAPLNLTYVNLI